MKKIVNIILIIGVVFQNFLFIIPVKAEESLQASLDVVSVMQGGENLSLNNGKYQVYGGSAISASLKLNNKKINTDYIYLVEKEGQSWGGQKISDKIKSEISLNMDKKETDYTYTLCESNKNMECVKVVDVKTLSFELAIFDEIERSMFYLTKVQQSGKEIIPVFDKDWNNAQFNLNSVEDVKLTFVGENLKDDMKYNFIQNVSETFRYEFMGTDIENGVVVRIPLNIMSQKDINMNVFLDIFNGSLPMMYKDSDGTHSFSFSISEDEEFNPAVVKVKHQGKKLSIDNNALYLDGDIYTIKPADYDKSKPITLNIKTKDLLDKDYKTSIVISRNDVELYSGLVNINGLLLNNGYDFDIDNLKLVIPTDVFNNIYEYEILVTVNGITTRTYLTYRESGVLSTSLFYGTGEKTIVIQGGMYSIYGGGLAYNVNSRIFEEYETMYFHFKGKEFENDVNYSYEFYCGSDEKNLDLITSGTVLGRVLNENGFMQEVTNNSYEMPTYYFVVKKENNLVYYGQNVLIKVDEPSLTTVKLTSNNKNVYMQMSDYKYIATKNAPLSVVIDGIGFENDKEYSFVIDDNYTYDDNIEQNPVYKVSGRDLNEGKVKIKISKGEDDKPTRSIYIDVFDGDGMGISYGGFEIEYVDSKKYFPDDNPYIIDNGKDLIKGIKKKTDVEDFIDDTKVHDGGKVKVYDASGNEVSGNVGTGMIARISDKYDNNVLDLDVVVKGDVSGDGNISITDLVQVERHLTGEEELYGVYEVAGNVTDSGSIGPTDVVKICQDVSGVEEVK